jgi:GxxExxY protein
MLALLRAAAERVHGELGPGYTEENYQKALAVELGLRGAACSMEESRPCFYRGQYIGQCRADIVAAHGGERACVELKQAAAAGPAAMAKWRAQAAKYSAWFAGHTAYLVVFTPDAALAEAVAVAEAPAGARAPLPAGAGAGAGARAASDVCTRAGHIQ